ncbi:hypothetical protein F4821DRAFT_77056 [Hypoxylon rubiginosum]|uniref:Uncharacterized protein n=1 Tax=Hypoxylon rubiginosum TaxID=110542 RepID=A0ACC0DKJ6_9PEZI|nr:hypothetical protein F4821DRAFT_77056 [Hypoxylon rubiginosum]
MVLFLVVAIDGIAVVIGVSIVLNLILFFAFTPSVVVSVWRVSNIVLISPVDESVGAVSVGVGRRFSSVRGSDSDRGRVHRQAVCELHFARCVSSPAAVPPRSMFRCAALVLSCSYQVPPGANLKRSHGTRPASYPDATSVTVPCACAAVPCMMYDVRYLEKAIKNSSAIIFSSFSCMRFLHFCTFALWHLCLCASFSCALWPCACARAKRTRKPQVFPSWQPSCDGHSSSPNTLIPYPYTNSSLATHHLHCRS